MSAFLTRGDGARSVKLTTQQDGVAVSIAGCTFETFIPNRYGGRMTIANGSHTIVEAGGADVGRVNVALSAQNILELPLGKDIRICTKVTNGSLITHFWGTIPEVREAI